jgi:hypothetical protein
MISLTDELIAAKLKHVQVCIWLYLLISFVSAWKYISICYYLHYSIATFRKINNSITIAFGASVPKMNISLTAF